MWFWANKVAIVTDGESELGICVINSLIESKMIVVGLCISDEGLNDVKRKLTITEENDTAAQLILYKCDITNEEQLRNIFKEVKEKYDGPSVLINNVFCDLNCCLCDGDLKDVKTIIDVNINAVLACTRLAAGNIIESKDSGHIIFLTDSPNLNSIQSNTFTAAVSAVNSIGDILRKEFSYVAADIKVTNIVLGADGIEESTPKKQKSEVAEIVKYVLNTPKHMQIREVSLDLD